MLSQDGEKGVLVVVHEKLAKVRLIQGAYAPNSALWKRLVGRGKNEVLAIPLTLHHRKGSGARLLLDEEGKHVNDIAHVVVDFSGLLQLPVFKKVADILRVAPLKKNETLKVGCWLRAQAQRFRGRVVTIRISHS